MLSSILTIVFVLGLSRNSDRYFSKEKAIYSFALYEIVMLRVKSLEVNFNKIILRWTLQYWELGWRIQKKFMPAGRWCDVIFFAHSLFRFCLRKRQDQELDVDIIWETTTLLLAPSMISFFTTQIILSTLDKFCQFQKQSQDFLLKKRQNWCAWMTKKRFSPDLI